MNQQEAKNFIESLIFSAKEPLSKDNIKKMLLSYCDFDVDKLLQELKADYSNRGINLECINKNFFFFKTSNNLKEFLNIQTKKTRNLSQAAMETLAIISYHQRGIPKFDQI